MRSVLAIPFLVACATEPPDVVVGPQPDDEPTTGGHDTAAIRGRGDVPVAGCADCLSAGRFDFSVTGSEFLGMTGLTVVAAAIENDLSVSPHAERRPVLISARVDSSGAFFLGCPEALTESGYPSYALYVDRDGSGDCGPGDLGFTTQFYAWNADVEEQVTAAMFVPLPSAEVGGPWFGQGDFCSGFFY